jgi:capsular polysaccharide biosynthesis protein
LRAGPPPVARLSQVIAHPSYSALYDAEGKIIPESSIYVIPPNAPQSVKDKFSQSRELLQFEPQTIPTSDLERSSETVVFGGASHFHFGHHLLDGMSRLWFHSDEPTLYLDALPKMRGSHPFISEYRQLGRERRLYSLERPTLFANVVLPHASIQNGFLIYSNADAEHLAIAESASKRATSQVPSKVYLSRKAIGNRKCDGEEELEQRLSLHGFTIVRPETLLIADQISIFNSADWIVGAVGSAFHNVLFTRRGAQTRTVQFTWKKPDLRYAMIDRVKGHTSYYVRTMSCEIVGSKITSTQIDVEKSLSVLDAIGAL